MAPPSSPLVLSRPPRAPKAPSISIHLDPVEKSGIPAGPSSCRSTHFLDGFNVDACLDVHSIPDPPTPQPRKRRLSTPVNLRSLEDVTNNPAAKQGSKRKDGDKKRKARKSLCHVPSPTIVQKDPVVPPLLPPSLDERSHPNIGESDTQQEIMVKTPFAAKTSICFDDDNDDDNDGDNDDTTHRCNSSSRKGSRRRKKRQSMVIPTDLIIPPEPLDNAQAVLPKVSPPSSTINKKKFEGSSQDMKDLQALVRGYCDLPEEERDTSEQARAILESTAYPLHNNVHCPASPTSDRRSILRKIAPVIQDMDKRKVHDTKMLEDATRCRVEKGNRSGKYRYYSLDTNVKVPSEEYKDRYMAFIEHGASRRAAQAEAWKEKLIEDQEEFAEEQDKAAASVDEDLEMREPLTTEVISTQEKGVVNPLSPLSESERSEAKLEIESPRLELQAQEGAATESVPAADQVVEEEKSEDQQQQQEADESMDLCNMSASLDMGEVDALPFDSDGGSESEEQAKTASKSMQGKESSATQQNQEEPAEDRRLQPLVALPSRERGQSNDPEVARAEKKLWKRIDDALQDYSDEVMQIMQRRKRQKTMKNEK